MRLLPWPLLVALLSRWRVDGIVQPAVPLRRHQGRLGERFVDHPAPRLAVRPHTAPLDIIAVAGLVLAEQLALPPDGEAGPPGVSAPPAEDLFQHAHVSQPMKNCLAARRPLPAGRGITYPLSRVQSAVWRGR